MLLSETEKEIERELCQSSKFCEKISLDLITMVAASKKIKVLFHSVDNQNIQFVDVLINCNQRKIISQHFVQEYFIDAWDGDFEMNGIQTFLTFLSILLLPILWLLLSMPISLRFKKDGSIINKIPFIRFSCFFVSHLYFIVLLILVAVEPVIPITSMIYSVNLPNYLEWMLLMWISGLVARELSNSSDKGGFGIFKIAVLILSTTACVINIISFCYQANDSLRYDVLFTRNIFLSLTVFFATIQFVDFLQFHILVGSWAILLRFIVNDLIRLFVLSMIFMMGFTFLITAINQDVYPSNSTQTSDNSLKDVLTTVKFLFFAIFQHPDPLDMPNEGFPHNKLSLITFSLIFLNLRYASIFFNYNSKNCIWYIFSFNRNHLHKQFSCYVEIQL